MESQPLDARSAASCFKRGPNGLKGQTGLGIWEKIGALSVLGLQQLKDRGKHRININNPDLSALGLGDTDYAVLKVPPPGGSVSPPIACPIPCLLT